MFYHFCHHLIRNLNSLSFWKDIFPVLLSSFAVIISVLIPYLIIKYEKVFTRNKEQRDFLRKMELFIMEWLNITDANTDIADKFLEALTKENPFFIKRFQLYELPPLDFFNTYNVGLLNECYAEIRQLKNLSHQLDILNSEYSAYRRMIMDNKGKDMFVNTKDFYTEFLKNIQKENKRVIKDLNELRLIVYLLIEDVNKTKSLTLSKFFSFNPKNMLWYKNNIKFTKEELENGRAFLEKHKEEYSKKKSPLDSVE